MHGERDLRPVKAETNNGYLDCCKAITVQRGFIKMRQSGLLDSAELPRLDRDTSSTLRLICSTAHWACSAMSGSGSFAADSSAGRSPALPTFPSATQTFLRKPRRLIRLIGDLRNICRNCSSASDR